MNTWGDFLEKLLPKALTIARQEDLEYRAGLPRDFLDYTGVSKADLDSPHRGPFLKKYGLQISIYMLLKIRKIINGPNVETHFLFFEWKFNNFSESDCRIISLKCIDRLTVLTT